MRTETALVLCIPESENLVSGWRQKHDTSAAQGMPAHVTVLFPFKPVELIDAACLSKLTEVFSRVPSFDLTFSRLDRFPEVLWLAPEPVAPIKQLTKVLVTAFPECPPYRGAFPDPIPHLTVAQGADSVLEKVAAELDANLGTPIRSRVAECSLFARLTEGWREQRRFVLAGINHPKHSN